MEREKNVDGEEGKERSDLSTNAAIRRVLGRLLEKRGRETAGRRSSQDLALDD